MDSGVGARCEGFGGVDFEDGLEEGKGGEGKGKEGEGKGGEGEGGDGGEDGEGEGGEVEAGGRAGSNAVVRGCW